MAGYADVEDPVALLNRTPEGNTGPQVADAIRNAGFEVQAVNWVWERIVGESLVDSIIKPITGDFDKIAEQAGQWKNVAAALQAVRNNLNAGLGELQPGWQGEAADRFSNLIGTTWTLGIEADAQAANLIGFALNKVAQGSRMACDRILHLIKMLVDKLIEAAAMLPIPVVGWGRAVKLVYDGIQIYNAIMQLIEGIRAIISGAQMVIDGIQQVGSALSKIDDIHNLNDALNVANEAGQGIATTASGARQVQYGATQAAGAAGDLAQSASSARDNATALRDERAAARDQSLPGGTTGGGRPGGRDGQDTGTNRPANPSDTRTPENARNTCGDPVDVTTGDVVLGQTDVELPGVLPLVLRRTHVSSYRAGRSHGRSWASTLDQRLEVDDQGVVYVADDGMLLVYPDPPAGSETMPQVGPRWPLRRTETGYTIAKPESGQTLHFAAGPGPVRSLTAIADRNDNRISFLRDTAGVIAEIEHPGGYHIDVDTAAGLIAQLRLRTSGGPGITLVRYAYTGTGELAEVINSADLPLKFDYDRAGRITQWIDRNGQWYRYFYDEHGRCIANQGSGGLLNGTFSYDRDNRTTRYTDALGHATVHRFDARNNLLAETDPLGHTTTYEWDDHDRRSARTDPLGQTTRFGYDQDGNLTRVTRPDGSEATATYDHLGLPTTITEPDGAVWRHEYDERGNLVAVTDPAGAVSSYGYTARGAVASMTDPLGNTRRIDNDAAGLPIAVTDPLGATTRYVRDPFGRISRIINPVGGETRLGWSVEGSLISHTSPDGAAHVWRYDGEGNEVEHVEPSGHRTRAEYTGFDMLAARTGPDGARLEFGYDARLQLTSVTNARGQVWRYEYDPAGRLRSETNFDGHTVGYVYDAAGQLIERGTTADETVTFTRDALGRIVDKRVAGMVTSFAYDRMGRLIRASNPNAEVILRRDPLGRIVAESINGRTLASVYDQAGRRIGRSTPSGVESVWEYDANHQPAALHLAGRVLRFVHDPAGHEVERRLDTGTALAQRWDASHRLVAQSITVPGRDAQPARTVQQRAYRYRPDGYLVGISDQLAGPRRFDLDPSGRVIAIQGTNWAERYAYDQAGNLTAAVWPQSAAGEAQGEREYAGTALVRAGNTHFRHDNRGRTISRQRRTLSGNTRTWHYTWDAEDRLTEVVTPDGARWRYLYDPFGRRIAKQRVGDDGTTVSEEVTFTWDGVVLAEQVRTAGSVTAWEWEPYRFRPVTQTERRRSDDASQEWVDEQFYAIVTDLVGTPSELVDPEGNVAWRSRTTLWGAPLPGAAGPVDTPLRFPGQYHDPESGLSYNYFRYYDPETARYDSADPLGLAPAPNPTTYVANPTRLIDPLGLTPCTSQAPTDLHAFGNASGPRAPREGMDYEVGPDGMVIPQSGPLPRGASTFGDPTQGGLSGVYHRIPAGTRMPDGFAVVADGSDVLPSSPNNPTHHSVYPTRPMTPQEFVDGFLGLPWERAGKIK